MPPTPLLTVLRRDAGIQGRKEAGQGLLQEAMEQVTSTTQHMTNKLGAGSILEPLMLTTNTLDLSSTCTGVLAMAGG